MRLIGSLTAEEMRNRIEFLSAWLWTRQKASLRRILREARQVHSRQGTLAFSTHPG
jgi:hypothetical protein